MAEQRSQHEEFIMVTIVVGLIFGLGWAIWSVFQLELTNILRWIRLGEMHLASLFVGDDFSVYYPGYNDQFLKDWLNWLPSADAADIRTDHIKIMTYLTMRPLRVFFTVLLALMASWAIIFGPGANFRRQMGLQQLLEEQAKMFPVISPFMEYNPSKQAPRAPGSPVPKNLPLFSEALAPEEWVAYNRIAFRDSKLDPNRTYQALATQLGKRWRGPLSLPLHAQGLYAAFALKAVRKRDESDELLSELARSWSPEKGLVLSVKTKRYIKQVIKNPKIGKTLAPYVNKHAYQTTAMLRALQRAREEGGVLAPATFVWLRGYDRNLWYPLNNLGRKAYHAEASGAMSHFTHELIAGQRIPAPKFEDVIASIEETLTGPSGRPIPKLAE